MGFQARCPACGQHFLAPKTAAGHRVKCPFCEHIWPLAVPDAAPPDIPAASPNLVAGGWLDERMSETYPIAAEAAENRPSEAPGPKRLCDVCGEPVGATTVLCPYCRAAQDLKPRSEARRTNRSKTFVGGLFAWLGSLLGPRISNALGVCFGVAVLVLYVAIPLYMLSQALWLDHWLRTDAHQGVAVITGESWWSRSRFPRYTYQYTVNQEHYTATSGYESYSKLQPGDKVPVLYSASHPWLSSLEEPWPVIGYFLLVGMIAMAYLLVTLKDWLLKGE